MIGKNLPAIDSLEKVTGTLVYGGDFKLAGMLFGTVLRSPIPHGRIISIDTEKAKSLPGVKAVITGYDLDLPNYSVAGEKTLDERLLTKDKVRYCGDEIALVAAVDEETALQALELIKVEFEEFPAVLDLEKALNDQSVLVHEDQGTNIAREIKYSFGEVEKAFLESDVIVTGRFETSRVHHGYLEPHAAVAQWDIKGKLTLWIPTQSPTLARITYAKALGIDITKVRVIQMPLGGGFGGKLEYKLHPLCALLAKETGRPVKMVNSRREEFLASLPRMPMVIEMKLGARKDGTFLAKETRILADNGAYLNYGPGILLSATHRHDNLYRINNISARSHLIYTNKMPTGAFRGFGCPQSHFAFESLIDKLARELDIDPAELRMKNASQKGDITVYKWNLESCGLSECIEKSLVAADWDSKKKAAPKKTKSTARGIGIACCLHVSGNRTFLPFFDGSSAIVKVDGEGRVIVLTGEVDLGQGSKTVFAMIAANELGIPVDWVNVPDVDSDISPHGLGTFGDRVTTLSGNAVKKAAIDAREQILALVAEEHGVSANSLIIKEGIITDLKDPLRKLNFLDEIRRISFRLAGGSILGKGSFSPQNVTVVDPETKVGNISCAYPFVVQVAEVEVNCETGEVDLLNFVSSHDLGRVINPLMAKGQVFGAVAQGVGFAMSEELIESKGLIKNLSFRHYPMPRSIDLPNVSTIFVESNDPNGPYGAKGLGEPALTAIAPAIANAIFDAVGVQIMSLPITPEKVLKAIKEKPPKLPERVQTPSRIEK